jgi:hypothetical protein
MNNFEAIDVNDEELQERLNNSKLAREEIR